jgi:6-pyruvoyltetrahydropterin/6-carboxytetrahydropterin synthase
MYDISIKSHFDAAHQLRGYEGKCANEHGHRWEYMIALESKELDNLGMLVDFTIVKEWMKELEEILDHRNINKDVPVFAKMNPTAENLSKFIFDFIKDELEIYDQDETIRLVAIRVWESPECSATYFGD